LADVMCEKNLRLDYLLM